MLLIKCKCGCYFTTKLQNQEVDAFRCQNCDNRVSLYPTDWSYKRIHAVLEEVGMRVSEVPDDATLEVKFTL